MRTPGVGLGDETKPDRTSEMPAERVRDLRGVFFGPLDVSRVRQRQNGRRVLARKEPAHREHRPHPRAQLVEHVITPGGDEVVARRRRLVARRWRHVHVFGGGPFGDMACARRAELRVVRRGGERTEGAERRPRLRDRGRGASGRGAWASGCLDVGVPEGRGDWGRAGRARVCRRLSARPSRRSRRGPRAVRRWGGRR